MKKSAYTSLNRNIVIYVENRKIAIMSNAVMAYLYASLAFLAPISLPTNVVVAIDIP